MLTYEKLTLLGKRIDNLQQLNYNSAPWEEICGEFTIIEKELSNESEWTNDSNDHIVYCYTKANYLTILIEIMHNYGDDSFSYEPYSHFFSAHELIYEYSLQRISLYRKALFLYEHQDEHIISKMWMNQVRVNLANMYNEIGRTIEAIEILEPIKDTFGMARINYASKLYQLSSFTLNKSEQKELLINALNYYRSTIENYPERRQYDPIPEDIFQNLNSMYESIKQTLESNYEKTDVNFDAFDNSDFDNIEYKKWCKEMRLILSFRNLYQDCSTWDNIHLPNMGISYFAQDDTLSYYSWYNTLIQEFNQARYYLYCAEKLDANEIHESQQHVFLVNTLDYPAIGYRTESLKSSMKSAYGVLDKIGLLCNDFVRGKNMPAKKITFNNWYNGIEEELQIHNSFTPLYWIAKDIAKDGAFENLRKMRNVIEHRYLRVVDQSKTPLEVELQNNDKMEYTVGFSDLQKQTHQLLRLIRALLFYVVIAFNLCYLDAMKICKRENEIFIPLTLDSYDDDWKN